MYKGTFKLGGDVVEAIIKEGELLFFDVSSGLITTIQGLKFSKAGVLKEFPDLKNKKEWKLIAIDRLKEHMKKLKTEKAKLYYVKEELEKFGYEALYEQRIGFRPRKFK